MDNLVITVSHLELLKCKKILSILHNTCDTAKFCQAVKNLPFLLVNR